MERVTGDTVRSTGVGSASNGAAVTVAGVVGLVVTKAADIATTVVGLRASSGLIERNPLANAAIAEYGTLPGLFALGALSVLVIVCVVEGAFRLSARFGTAVEDPAVTERTGRVVCYGVGCACNGTVALYNTLLIAGVLAG